MKRCEFAGFVHHAVSGCETGRGLPQRDLDRVVPGADAGADA